MHEKCVFHNLFVINFFEKLKKKESYIFVKVSINQAVLKNSVHVK